MANNSLIKYRDFAERFEAAKKNNGLNFFINELTELVQKNLNIYLSHLFLARSFVFVNDLTQATMHYKTALNLAKDPNWLQNEVDEFISDNRIDLKDAEIRYKNIRNSSNQVLQLLECEALYELSELRSENFIHFYITLLQKLKHYEKAHLVLDELIAKDDSLEKKSRYLLFKAQISSASDNYQSAIDSYLELININSKLNTKSSNLGHLHFEIAKMYRRLGDLDKGIQAAEKAYKYTSTPIIANFLNSIRRTDFQEVGGEFSIEVNDDQIDYVSPMLKIDIEDFDYRDGTVVKNGKVAIEDAERIYEKAQNNIKKDLSLVYPLYLEAAKAYNDLKPGTFNYDSFIDALAKYSAHKSNAIFYIYRIELSSLNPDANKLKRLKDSSCSYIETSLNLEKDTRKLLFLLTNYLKVTISYSLYNKGNKNFKEILNLKYFNQVIKYCTTHEDGEVIIRTHQAIIHFGSVSIRIWDRISRLSKDTEEFYNYLKSLRRLTTKKVIVEVLNSHENIKVDYNLNVGQLFYRYIINRRKQKLVFENNFSDLRNIGFLPNNISTIIEKWDQIKTDNGLFSETDFEISHAVDRILKNYLPYLDRTVSERTNILFQVRTEIDFQLKFILENTTYWGRAMFYPLFKKNGKQTLTD